MYDAGVGAALCGRSESVWPS
eukprot:COSAG04_NODE_22370_length_356_cov_0.642023_1_plen_20_part_10